MLGAGTGIRDSLTLDPNNKLTANPSNPAYCNERRVELGKLTDTDFSDLLAHFGLAPPAQISALQADCQQI